MSKLDGLRERAKDLIASAGLATLASPPVPSNEVWIVDQVAWEIDKATSGGNTRVRLYIVGHGYKHQLEEQDVPVAGTLYTYPYDLKLYPLERLAIDIDQAQASTTAEMHLTGRVEEV